MAGADRVEGTLFGNGERTGKLDEELFAGSTINTPSMLCVEDALDGLRWAEKIGGLATLQQRSQDNLGVMEDWVAGSGAWAAFLAPQATRSCTSICLRIVDGWYTVLPADAQQAQAKKLVKLLESEAVAYDIGAYRDAPPGLRIWGGATVEAADLQALTPWLDWGFASLRE